MIVARMSEAICGTNASDRQGPRISLALIRATALECEGRLQGAAVLMP
jgi:hypothetical protein